MACIDTEAKCLLRKARLKTFHTLTAMVESVQQAKATLMPDALLCDKLKQNTIIEIVYLIFLTFSLVFPTSGQVHYADETYVLDISRKVKKRLLTFLLGMKII
jgi:hypothetical protein